MNQVFETIKNRRSYRKYLPEQVSEEHLGIILETATLAPSAVNQQPWLFTVVQKRDLLDKINAGTKEIMGKQPVDWMQKYGTDPEYDIFYKAPTVVFVSGKTDSFTPLIDCSAAVQNMLLMAESLGIGSCWVGLVQYYFNEGFGREELQIPEGYTTYFCVTLGYKDPTHEIPERKMNPDVFQFIR